VVVYHCDGAQWYEKFLQVSRMDLALNLLGLGLSCKCLCIFILHGWYIWFFLHSLPLDELSLVGLAL